MAKKPPRPHPIVRVYPDVNSLIADHIEDIAASTDETIGQMVHVAMMTAAFILYMAHEGDTEAIIEDMAHYHQHAVEFIDGPHFVRVQ